MRPEVETGIPFTLTDQGQNARDQFVAVER